MGASYVFEDSELVREVSAQYSPEKGQHMMAHHNKLNNISIFSFLNLNTTSLFNFESPRLCASLPYSAHVVYFADEIVEQIKI
jgi:hypothetical protein